MARPMLRPEPEPVTRASLSSSRNGSRVIARSQEAAAEFYASGLEPGFAEDQLAPTLATLPRGIRSVRTQEIFSHATILMDGGMLSGVLYEPGIEPIRQMLAAAGEGGRGRGD